MHFVPTAVCAPGALLAALLAVAGVASADEVHLESGRSIEGKASAQGNKVVIAVESGHIVLSRNDVARIEHATAPLVEAERREAKLAPDDRTGLLQLADFCRDHGLAGKERDLLQRLLRLEPDHEGARRRLGFVRTDHGWEQRRELARREAAHHRESERAKLELRQKRAELALAEAELAREKKAPPARAVEPARAEPAPVAVPTHAPLLVAPYYPGPAAPFPLHYALPSALPSPPVQQPAFPINGARDPSSVTDEAFRRHFPAAGR